MTVSVQRAMTIDDVLALDDLGKQNAVMTEKVKKEPFRQNIKHHYEACDYIRNNWANNYGLETFDAWNGEPETLPTHDINDYKGAVPIVSGYPRDAAKLMELAEKQELRESLSSGTSGGPNGPKSRVFRDKITVDRAVRAYASVMRDYCHIGDTGNPTFQLLLAPPAGLKFWLSDANSMIYPRIGVEHEFGWVWPFNNGVPMGRPEPFDPKYALDRLKAESDKGKEISMLGSHDFVHMVMKEEEKSGYTLKFHAIQIGGGFKAGNANPEKTISEIKYGARRLLGEDKANEHFTDCLGFTETNQILCSPRTLDAGVVEDKPYIGYFMAPSPFMYVQVRDIKDKTVLTEIGAVGELTILDFLPESYPATFGTSDKVTIVGKSQDGSPKVKYLGRIEGRGKPTGCGDSFAKLDAAARQAS